MHLLLRIASRITANACLADLVVRDDVIGTVQISLVNLRAWHERIYFDGVIALDRDRVEFIIIDLDIGAFGILVSASLILALHWLARDLVNELLPESIAGLFVVLPERDALAC